MITTEIEQHSGTGVDLHGIRRFGPQNATKRERRQRILSSRVYSLSFFSVHSILLYLSLSAVPQALSLSVSLSIRVVLQSVREAAPPMVCFAASVVRLCVFGIELQRRVVRLSERERGQCIDSSPIALFLSSLLSLCTDSSILSTSTASANRPILSKTFPRHRKVSASLGFS